jgi:hypothetical protein
MTESTPPSHINPGTALPLGYYHHLQSRKETDSVVKEGPAERQYSDITLHLVLVVHITMQQPLLCWGA